MIEWTDAAIEAAMDAYGVLREFAEPHEFDAIRAALDAAVQAQRIDNLDYRMGVLDGALAALEEAAKVCEGDFDSEMRSYGKAFAAAIRALMEKKG